MNRLTPIRARAIIDAPTFDLGGFCRALLVSLIRAETDPEERSARIAIAQRDGHLTQEQAAALTREER